MTGQSYTKLELLVIMRMLEANIAYNGRKIYAAIVKSKHLIEQAVTIQ